MQHRPIKTLGSQVLGPQVLRSPCRSSVYSVRQSAVVQNAIILKSMYSVQCKKDCTRKNFNPKYLGRPCLRVSNQCLLTGLIHASCGTGTVITFINELLTHQCHNLGLNVENNVVA